MTMKKVALFFEFFRECVYINTYKHFIFKNMATTIRKSPKKKELTLLQAMERVVELSRDSKMSKEFFRKAKDEIKLLAESYGITEQQAVLFCVCMEKGPCRVDYDDIANYLDLNKIKVFSYAPDIDALVRRRLLKFRDVKEEDDFDIPTVVVRMLKHNEVYQLPKRIGIDCAELFELLESWFNDLKNDAISPRELKEEINTLFNDNPQIGFVRRVQALPLDDDDLLLLVYFCHLLVNDNDDDIRFGQIEDVFDSSADFNRAKVKLRSGEHRLMRKKLIEHLCEDGIADTTKYHLTANAKRDLLEEMKIIPVEENLANTLKPSELTPKKMFYPKEVEKQVKELAQLFKDEEFKKIQERMKEKGFRNGFACLFYGGPGTGKTETVYQLALQTERSIMVVDVPQIKSKWVGDSEKNIKALFDRYREMVKRSKIAPILLFNEADAIIGIRQEGAQRAVEKMENSIQNIILQEMETLDGIMIATTNLQQNLDKAFERRFLYKVKFEKPTAEARAGIWHEMIPELNVAAVRILSDKYDFSGGQIENIARRYSIDHILHGEREDVIDLLSEYCDSEQLETRDRRRIGF